MSKMMNQSDFFAALEAARQPKHGGGHAFSRAWAAGELSRAQLGEWAIQHFYYIDPIPQQFAQLYARLPQYQRADIRAVIVRAMWRGQVQRVVGRGYRLTNNN